MNKNVIFNKKIYFFLLLLIGLILEIYAAWQNRFWENPDEGIVALMAKHMAEGKDFPFFFYGQAYMGSLEPIVTALLFVIFGVSGFVANLGSVACFFWILPILYFWAKDVEGEKAGFLTLIYAVLGPPCFYYYSYTPRGGYALTIVFSALILWLTSRYVFKEVNKQPTYKINYFILGIVSGLAWWTNQLIVATLITSFLIFIIFLRTKIFQKKIIVFGFTGFIIGSLPFWLWNIFNNFDTSKFVNSFGRTSFETGLKSFFLEKFPIIINILPDHTIRFWIEISVCFIIFTIFIISIIKSYKSSNTIRFINGINIIFFIIISAIIFSRTHYASMNTPRYLIPIVAPFAIIIGTSIAIISKKIKFAWMLILIFLYNQVVSIPDFNSIKKNNIEFYENTIPLQQFLEKQNLHSVYIKYYDHGLNFVLKEQFCFSELNGDRYEPYNHFNETQDKIGILKNYGDVDKFLSINGGEAKIYSELSDRFNNIYYDFVPPQRNLTMLDNSLIKEITDSSGKSIKKIIMDNNSESVWQSSKPVNESDWIIIEFYKPVEGAFCRILGINQKSYPKNFYIEAQKDGDSEWISLSPKNSSSNFYWNGPRPYYFGDYFRLEIQFPVIPLTKLKIVNTCLHHVWSIKELQIFISKNENVISEEESLNLLLKTLNEYNIKRLYADRWVSNAVYKETNGKIATTLDSKMFKNSPSYINSDIHIDSYTAILLRNEQSDIAKSLLNLRFIEFKNISIGPWQLFYFKNISTSQKFKFTNLLFTGYGLITFNNKQSADILFQELQSQISNQKSLEQVSKTLKAVIKNYENYQPALKQLAENELKLGNVKEAEILGNLYNDKVSPKYQAFATFDNGIEFLGLNINKATIKRGETLKIEYFWTFPSKEQYGKYQVFFHGVLNDKIIFQDDHVLLNEVALNNIKNQPFKEVFKEIRYIILPTNIPIGKYNFVIGLTEIGNDRRLKNKGEFSTSHRAVNIPISLTITE